MKNELCLVYITAANHTEALSLGRTLVERRLAACINILGAMTSIYRWQGSISEGQEVAFLAKTDRARVEDLLKAVGELHSYTVPCALVLPITGGLEPYSQWLRSELQA